MTRPSQTRPRHARRHPRAFLPTVAAAALAALGFTGVFVGANAAVLDARLSSRTHDISALDGSEDEAAAADQDTIQAADDSPVDANEGEALNILVLGADIRTGENAELGGYVDGARADVTIVLHISADRSRIEMVSIPRDTETAISACESEDGATSYARTDKINSAFNTGYMFNAEIHEGVACTMRTVSDLTGIDFDSQYVFADFAGFKNIVDALGGVPMCIPYDMVSAKADLDLQAGPQTLDGAQALALARARYGLDDGTDLMRIQRQQELIKAILQKALSVNAFTDADVLTDFVTAGTESLTMSPDFGSLSYDLGLLYSLRGFSLGNLTMITAPWSYMDGGGVQLTSYADDVWEALRNDTPLADVGTTDSDNATFVPAATDEDETDAVDTDDEALAYLPIPPSESYEAALTDEQVLDACAVG